MDLASILYAFARRSASSRRFLPISLLSPTMHQTAGFQRCRRSPCVYNLLKICPFPPKERKKRGPPNGRGAPATDLAPQRRPRCSQTPPGSILDDFYRFGVDFGQIFDGFWKKFDNFYNDFAIDLGSIFDPTPLTHQRPNDNHQRQIIK